MTATPPPCPFCLALCPLYLSFCKVRDTIFTNAMEVVDGNPDTWQPLESCPGRARAFPGAACRSCRRDAPDHQCLETELYCPSALLAFLLAQQLSKRVDELFFLKGEPT